jgi:hypothetical protein
MKLIAHRGLINGPDRSIENAPAQIMRSLSMGFECEVDLRIENDEFYLGHDGPEYHTTESFLRKPGLWIHAKNLNALNWLTTTDLNYFWHQEDDFVVTSYKQIWTYPGKELTPNSVAVMPEWNDPNFENIPTNCFGICSDYVLQISNILKG